MHRWIALTQRREVEAQGSFIHRKLWHHATPDAPPSTKRKHECPFPCAGCRSTARTYELDAAPGLLALNVSSKAFKHTTSFSSPPRKRLHRLLFAIAPCASTSTATATASTSANATAVPYNRTQEAEGAPARPPPPRPAVLDTSSPCVPSNSHPSPLCASVGRVVCARTPPPPVRAPIPCRGPKPSTPPRCSTNPFLSPSPPSYGANATGGNAIAASGKKETLPLAAPARRHRVHVGGGDCECDEGVGEDVWAGCGEEEEGEGMEDVDADLGVDDEGEHADADVAEEGEGEEEDEDMVMGHAQRRLVGAVVLDTPPPAMGRLIAASVSSSSSLYPPCSHPHSPPRPHLVRSPTTPPRQTPTTSKERKTRWTSTRTLPQMSASWIVVEGGDWEMVEVWGRDGGELGSRIVASGPTSASRAPAYERAQVHTTPPSFGRAARPHSDEWRVLPLSSHSSPASSPSHSSPASSPSRTSSRGTSLPPPYPPLLAGVRCRLSTPAATDSSSDGRRVITPPRPQPALVCQTELSVGCPSPRLPPLLHGGSESTLSVERRVIGGPSSPSSVSAYKAY
ncbi:hypothetical protein C8R47DRAFT_1196309 [Mycena vitilis]|nr:hypothetical protein C8R47DRAFT_1196309 [Mycena vitilis]